MWIAGALLGSRVVVGTGTGDKITKFSSAGVIADSILSESGTTLTISNNVIVSGLTASQLVVTNGSKQLVSSTDISSLTLTLDGGDFLISKMIINRNPLSKDWGFFWLIYILYIYYYRTYRGLQINEKY